MLKPLHTPRDSGTVLLVQAVWEPLHSMEQFVARAQSLGIGEDSLTLARLTLTLARQSPPVDADSSWRLWHTVCCHAEAAGYINDPFSVYLASMAWREGHLRFVEVPRREGARRRAYHRAVAWWTSRRGQSFRVAHYPW